MLIWVAAVSVICVSYSITARDLRVLRILEYIVHVVRVLCQIVGVFGNACVVQVTETVVAGVAERHTAGSTVVGGTLPGAVLNRLDASEERLV